MKTVKNFTVAVLLVLLWLPWKGMSQNTDPVRYEVLLDSKLLSGSKITGDLRGCLDFTSGRLVVFASPEQMYLLGWGGIVPLGQKIKPSPESFAFTPDSVMLITRGNQLCYLDSSGRVAEMFGLPSPGMGIARGAHVMYLFTRKVSSGPAALYLLAPGGKYSKVLEVPGPIMAVQEYGDALLFCTENGLFQYKPIGKELTTIAVMTDGASITSVAADQENGRIFFATSNKVFTAEGSTIRMITDRLGGTLMFREGLVIFDPAKKLMLRIKGLTGEYLAREIVTPPLTVGQVTTLTEGQVTPITGLSTHNAAILGNEEVISLVRSNLSEDLIIQLIRQVKCRFSLGVDDLVSLSEQHVPPRVILAMKEAMENKRTSGN